MLCLLPACSNDRHNESGDETVTPVPDTSSDKIEDITEISETDNEQDVPSFPILSVSVEDYNTYVLANKDYPKMTGDLWPCTWGDDNRLYTANGDGLGFSLIAGDIVFNIVDGFPPDCTGYTPPDAWGQYIAGQYADDITLNRKPTGLTCVDGDIYLFSQNLRNGFSDNPFGDAPHASVSVSHDHGLTWTYDADKPMFTDHVFTTGFFLDYGKCQEHRKDDYEYVYGLDYNWRFSKDFLQTKMYLARVPRNSIMKREAWEFFAGINGKAPLWLPDIELRIPVIEDTDLYCKDQSAVAQGSVVYIPQLNRYLYSSRAECVWIFYESEMPWGPWKKITVKEWKGKWTEKYHAGYNAIIPSKFLNKDGLGGWIISSLSSSTFGGKYYNMGFRRFTITADQLGKVSK
jgi:hypothetical protein